MPSHESLKEELDFFETLREELLKTNTGQYALVKGKEFFGAFTTEEEAYNEGVSKFGTEQFLVKQVTAEDVIYKISALHVGAPSS